MCVRVYMCECVCVYVHELHDVIIWSVCLSLMCLYMCILIDFLFILIEYMYTWVAAQTTVHYNCVVPTTGYQGDVTTAHNERCHRHAPWYARLPAIRLCNVAAQRM